MSSAQTPGPGQTPGPAAKRRRVEVANSTLRKPFRSPLITGSNRPISRPPATPAGVPGSDSGGVRAVGGSGAGTGTGTGASPSLRYGQSSSLGLGLGLGQSPLRFKTPVGEDCEIADSDDEGGFDDDNDDEDGEDGEASTITTEQGSSSTDSSFQIPASPSLRTTTSGVTRRGRSPGPGPGSVSGSGGALRGTGQNQGGRSSLEGRRYPPPSTTTSVSTTPVRTAAATTPGRLLTSRNNTGISYRQTPSKQLISSSSSLLAAGARSHRTPGTPKVVNSTDAHNDKTNKEYKPEEKDDFDLDFLQTATLQTQSQISEIEKQLDIAKQARRIQERGSNRELELLIEKWKQASRQAAEDLFELIRGRVEGMGGGRAWRDSRRQQREHGGWGSFDDGDNTRGKRRRRKKRRGAEGDDYDEYGDEDGDGEGEQEKEDDDEEDDEDEDEDEGDGRGEDGGGEDTGFTMTMMLQSLNIEPDVLGWDPGEEKWRD